ncbi:lipopolysaccharide biosynthesis protein [Deinococcus sedimenti]|nr:oligosaccharide flippase family protein [Deinococcus sedimenti]
MQRIVRFIEFKPLASLLTIGDQMIFPGMLVLFSHFFITRLGIENYGLWLLAFTLGSLTPVFVMGVPDHLVRALNSRTADGLDGAPLSQEISRSVMLISGVALLLGSAFYLLRSPITALLTGQVHQAEVLGLLAPGLALRVVDLLQQALLQGRERYGTAALINILTIVLTFTAAMAAVYQGQGVRSVLLLTVAGWAAMALAKAAVNFPMMRRHWRMQAGAASGSPRTLTLIRQGTPFWVQNVSSLATSYLDRLLVSSHLGVQSLAVYTLVTQVTLLVQLVSAKAFSVHFPELVRISQGGSLMHLRRKFYSLLATSIGMGAAACLFYAVFGQDVSRILIQDGGKSSGLILLLSVHYAWLATSTAPYYLLNASGHAGMNASLGTVVALINVLLGFLGVLLYGLPGLIAAKFLGWPVAFVSRNYVHRVVLKDGGRWSFLRSLIPFATVIGTVVLFTGLQSQPLSLKLPAFLAMSAALWLLLRASHRWISVRYQEERI